MTDELLHLSDRQTLRVIVDTPERLDVESTWQPGGAPPPSHLHPAQDEEFELRSGRLTAIVDGVEHQLGPGEQLEIPRDTTHTLWNAGSEKPVALWRTRPAGRTAEWFRTVDRLGGGGTRTAAPSLLLEALTEYSDVFQLAAGR
jgi:mannose-6-phosphate isomerase-like protein (cupin superfamily)